MLKRRPFLPWASFVGLYCFFVWGCTAPTGNKACSRDEQCAIGRFCDNEIKRCQDGCTSDTRCPEGQSCYQKACASKVCKAQEQRACEASKTPLPGTPCRQGFQRCIKNGQAWSVCVGKVSPQKEFCDGVDNDCNGQVDDVAQGDCSCFPAGAFRSCYTGPPESLAVSDAACHKGVQFCSSTGSWSKCERERTPQVERCNGIDDDCDGLIDNTADPDEPACVCQEGGDRVCQLASLRCAQGQQLCEKRGANQFRWGACTRIDNNALLLPLPPEEIGKSSGCNGKDDDCDGRIDNQSNDPNKVLERPCYPGLPGCKSQNGFQYTFKCQGNCRPGLSRCVDGKWTNCQQAVTPKTEACDNGKDDNCDGTIDEGC